MGESIRAVLGALVIFGVLALGLVWIDRTHSNTAIAWDLKIGLPVVIVFATLALNWNRFRTDRAPDFLRQMGRRPFERDGVCFSIVPFARHGVMYLNFVFQNQRSRPCDLLVVVSPPLNLLGPRPFHGVGMNIHCEGGGFGVARTPIGVPREFQGQMARFDVTATTEYPNGKGSRLRFRNGMRVGKAGVSSDDSVGLTVVLALVGHVHFKTPAHTSFMLPSGVLEDPPPLPPTAETLWEPGDSTDGMADRLRLALAGGY